MDPLIIGLVAASALLHVAWNVRLKTAGDPLRTATIGLIVGSFVDPCRSRSPCGWGPGRRRSSPAGIAFGLASGVFEAAYFVLLAEAYRRGDLSVVYPLARGTAPLLLVAVGVAPAGRAARARPGWVGVACLLAGFLALQRPWQALAGPGRRPPAGCRDRVRHRDRRHDRLLHVPRSARHARDRPRSSTPRSCGSSGAILLVIWVAVVAGGGLWSGGPEQNRRAAVGGVLTLGGLPAHPVRPERRPADGGRAAARVGDGHRRDLGCRAPGRGRVTWRCDPADRRLGDHRPRRAAAGAGRLGQADPATAPGVRPAGARTRRRRP